MSELELLQMFLRYNPETGDLRWAMSRPRLPGESEAAHRRWHNLYAGRVPGSTQQNGRQLRRVFQLRGKQYSAHRVACALLQGVVPREGDVTAENGNYLDLRGDNLEMADSRNQSDHRPVAKGGHRGVYWHERSQRWYARDDKDRHIGMFSTAEEALAARNAHLEANNATQRSTAAMLKKQNSLTHLQSLLDIHRSRFGTTQVLAEIAEQEELRQQACGLPHLAKIARREQLAKERREAEMDTRLPHAP